ncbi:MAG: hypothetical protein ABIL49_08340 [candidate division WOR-3 bacterium]
MVIEIVKMLLDDFLDRGDIFFVYYSEGTTFFEFCATREKIEEFFDKKVKNIISNISKVQLKFPEGKDAFIVANDSEKFLFIVIRLYMKYMKFKPNGLN